MQGTAARRGLERLLGAEVVREGEPTPDLVGHFLRIGLLITLLLAFAATELSERYLQTLTVRPTRTEALDVAGELAGELSFRVRLLARQAGAQRDVVDAELVARAVDQLPAAEHLGPLSFRVWSPEGPLLYSTLPDERASPAAGGAQAVVARAGARLRSASSPPGLVEEPSLYWDVRVPLEGPVLPAGEPQTWGVLQVLQTVEPGAAMDLQRARPLLRRMITLSMTLLFGALLGVVFRGQAALARRTREREEAHRELARLTAQLERRVQERTRTLEEVQKRLRAALDHLGDAQEEEWRLVSQQIHDSVLQYVIAADMHLKVLGDELPPDARELEDYRMALARLQRAIDEGRRIISHLRPPALDDFGLEETLRRYVTRLGGERRCPVAFRAELSRELSPRLQEVLFRVVQGALIDIRRRPMSRLEVDLREVEGEVQVRVTVSHPSAPPDPEDPDARELARRALQERVRLLGGWHRVDRRPGGTEVRAGLPVTA